MRVICDNQKEYDDFIMACKVIHDFSIFFSGMSEKTAEKVRIRIHNDDERSYKSFKKKKFGVWRDFYTGVITGISLPLDEYPALNTLAGMYDTDAKNRDKLVKVKKSKQRLRR